MSKRITPNYMNRNSEFKWLVNDNNTLIQCKAIRIHGPCKIDLANEDESSFGCARILVTDATVEVIDPFVEAKELIPLKFNAYGFSKKNGSSDEYESFAAFAMYADGTFAGLPT